MGFSKQFSKKFQFIVKITEYKLQIFNKVWEVLWSKLNSAQKTYGTKRDFKNHYL